MKTLFTLAAFVCLAVSAQAQHLTQYYNYSSKPTDDPSKARYVSDFKFSDSLWYRTDYFLPEKTVHLKGSYKDSDGKIKHGLYTIFYVNGNLESGGIYVNNKKQGLWKEYHPNGRTADSAVFAEGKATGLRLKWHPNGALSDSTVFNADGSGVHYAWFDNGIPSEAGRFEAGEKKKGKWQFFHANGALSSLEVYDTGALRSVQYYDEQGAPLTDTANKNSKGGFPGGTQGWAKYLGSNLKATVPFDKGAPNGSYTVVVRFAVDANGYPVDIAPLTKCGYGREEDVVRIIFRGPKWLPAVSHGRKVKMYRTQPVTFVVAR